MTSHGTLVGRDSNQIRDLLLKPGARNRPRAGKHCYLNLVAMIEQAIENFEQYRLALVWLASQKYRDPDLARTSGLRPGKKEVWFHADREDGHGLVGSA